MIEVGEYGRTNLGNIIEVDDGYLLIADSERTLSLNYATTNVANESRDIFIQKMSKDFKIFTHFQLMVLG